MDYISEGLSQAFRLISAMDREMLSAVGVSLRVSATAIAMACVFGIPFGLFLGIREFFGKSLVVTGLNTLMALPTVTVGLVVYALLSRRGALGVLGLLYTPKAMVIGQVILAFPIIAALCLSATQAVDPRARRTALALGAGPAQVSWTIMREARFGILASVMAGFGRVVSEVGCAMMLGGNIRGMTRTMTTAIALETGRGKFGLGIALGIVLLLIAFTVNLVTQVLRASARSS
ncbi:MAG: ABC transporter permease [Candidatus Latescibacteria bacterium]|nr:ABC transporter permease [Candidatus Latescibacterota bacterium]MCK5327899.1 ABC transporter permease [Candidatus Latescibacterota bacterium]